MTSETEDDDEYTRLLRAAAAIDPIPVRLELVDEILIGLLDLLRRDTAVHPAQWVQLDSSDREYVLRRGAMILIRAAGVRNKTWKALPAHGREQSDILLRGAEALGVHTGWAGWPETDGRRIFRP